MIPLRTAIAVLILAASVPLAACSRTDEKASGTSPEKIIIACATPPYTALVDIAQARGYFRQAGLEVSLHFHSTGKSALDEVLEGKADFATVAETPFMFAIMKGANISLIATIQSSIKNNAIVARKEKSISSPGDLKGKRIGASLGTIGEFFMDAFLAINGISRKDVNVVNLKPEEMLDALAGGSVDAVSTWPPFLNEEQKKLGNNGVVFYNEDICMQTFNVVTAQEQTRKNPVRIKKVLLALIKAAEIAKRNREEALQTVAAFRQIDRDLLRRLWPGNTFEVTLDQRLVLALEDESRWAIKGGLTAKKDVPNYLDFIYLNGLQSVKPHAVSILK